MATYIFGDLHGCFDEFSKLLDKIKFTPQKDEIIITGDIIGRGPKPLHTLNYLISVKELYPNSIHAVLGNHDLNFLAVAAGVHKAKHRDRIEAILTSDKLPKIIDFYLDLPLLYLDKNKKIAVCHAGIYPKWNLNEAEYLSDFIRKIMLDPIDRKLLLSNMFGDTPNCFTEDLKKTDLSLWRFIISAFTRMRLCTDDLVLDYGHSNCSVKDAQKDNLYPWFNFGKPYMYNDEEYTLFFGHWAALEAQCNAKNIIALDTGCVWENMLTCYCLETKERISVKSKTKIS